MIISLSHQIARLIRPLMLMTAFALFCSSNNAWAEPTEIEALRLENETLKKRVQELESIQSANAPEAPKVKLIIVPGKPWKSLQVNLSKADVTSVLGKPGKIDKWKTGEAWYYPNSRGGEVDFNADGMVTGWLEP